MATSGPPEELNSRHELMAYMEATGITSVEIARKLGYTYQRVCAIRKSDDYMALLADVKKEIREKVTDNASKLIDAFNNEAFPAFETLVALHTEAKNENVRLGAANSILDRAPDAPKVNKNTGLVDARTILQLPVQIVEGMNQALKDVGAAEIIDLYEEAGRFQLPEESEVAFKLVSLEELEEHSGA